MGQNAFVCAKRIHFKMYKINTYHIQMQIYNFICISFNDMDPTGRQNIQTKLKEKPDCGACSYIHVYSKFLFYQIFTYSLSTDAFYIVGQLLNFCFVTLANTVCLRQAYLIVSLFIRIQAYALDLLVMRFCLVLQRTAK